MNKQFVQILVILILMGTANAFAGVSPTEFVVENRLGKAFTIHIEFIHTQREHYYGPGMGFWEQSFGGFSAVDFQSYFEPVDTRTFKAGAKPSLFGYLWQPADKEIHEILRKIPSEDRMREVIKSLTITDEDGTVLLTLDTLSKATIEYNGKKKYTIILDESLYE